MMLSLFAVLVSVGLTSSFLIPPSAFHRLHSKTALFSQSDDDSFMKSLQNRMDQVEDRGTILPILILDSILPRQVLKIEVKDDAIFQALVKSRMQEETPFFGMIGIAELTGTGQAMPLQNGVEVEIVGKPELSETGLRVTLKGRRRFRIEANELSTASGGWTEARVVHFDSQTEEVEEDESVLKRAKTQAQTLLIPNMSGDNLVDAWIKLAKENERKPGQIDTLLQDIGDPPTSEEPSELAFWVGALINPLPGMGVAMEIRPLLLMAKTSEERVLVALKGISESIQHMNGTRRLF